MKLHHNPSLSPECSTAVPAVVEDDLASRKATEAADQAARGVRDAGAPPSITAPANCIRPLRHGVDSLYLSFPGEIEFELALCLQEAKELAQSNRETISALGAIAVGDHQFLVLPRGRGRFAFVIEDNWFSIQLSNVAGSAMPLALVQVRSEYLTAVGPDEAIRVVTSLINELGKVSGPPKISRLDLFADFTATYDLALVPGNHWVKRSKKRSIHEEADQVTGISFGAGNEVSARLYDKTREILKSGKDYMRPLWAGEGWDGATPVWRMEFQIRREGLPEPMTGTAGESIALCGSLWRYLCQEWLRLAVPSDSDGTRSRWPTHPLWEDLARTWDIDPEAPPMTRVPKAQLPSDDRLFRHGISGLTAFMAREGIEDYAHGLGEFLHALEAYYDNPNRQFPERLQDYIRRKTRSKARRYNVRMAGHEG